MLRSYLLTYPFLALYVAVVVPLFVPVTKITGSTVLIYWLARQGCRIAFGLAGITVHPQHLERAFEHPCCVFVANHASNLEAPALFRVLPRISVIMKESLGRIPLLGYTMRMGGFICVNRKARDSRKQALAQAVRTLQSGTSMLVFPEGTRNSGRALLPFRPGPFQMAIEAQVPVVPVTVHGATALMPKGARHMRSGRMTLFFHEPIPTTGLEATDRTALMHRVRTAMQVALDARPA